MPDVPQTGNCFTSRHYSKDVFFQVLHAGLCPVKLKKQSSVEKKTELDDFIDSYCSMRWKSDGPKVPKKNSFFAIYSFFKLNDQRTEASTHLFSSCASAVF